MTLAQAETAFRSVTQPRELVAVYVALKRFSIDDPQAVVFGALNGPDPARVLLIGEPGTGKSSAVHSALDGLSKMTGFACAPVFLTVGDVEVLKSGGAFLGHILQTLSAQADDYAGDLDAHELERAAASTTTLADARVSQGGRVIAPAVSYTATLHELSKAHQIVTSQAKSTKALGSLVSELTERGYRPVFIVDDTEKFAARQDGTIDETAAADLFRHGVDALCGIDAVFDVVVAVQPRYLVEARVIDEYAQRHGFARVHVPHLPRGVEPRPLAEILQHRLDVKGIKTPLEELVDREALVALETICGERAYDLRQVLNLASSAAALARQASSPTVSAAHVYAAQDATPER